jgi:Na+-translocating ferredoxin:NAD+ oxidoreductase RnfD subunit
MRTLALTLALGALSLLVAPEVLAQSQTTGTAPPGVVPRTGGLSPLIQFAIAWGLALAALLAAVVMRKLRGQGITTAVRLKANHVLPSGIQILIFAYWALYWQPLADHIWALGVQLLFAFTLDLAIGVAREGTWRVGLAPVPVVLSTNLFVWFTGSGFWLFFLLATIALVSKAALRREGTHIFNPSALGLSVVGLLCIPLPAPDFCYDIAHELNVAPSMTELLIGVALIAQLRVPIVLVSLGAAAALWASVEAPIFLARYLSVEGLDAFASYVPTWYWAPVLLVLALLATDPRTIPKTAPGRLVFGFLVGAGIVLMSAALTAAGQNDFMAKVLPIPIANYLAPWCDRVGARLDDRLKPALEPVYNRAHVALWVVLSALALLGPGNKADLYETKLHGMGLTRHIEGNACADNPAFCDAFSLGDELSLWTDPEPLVPPAPPDQAR